MENQRVITKKNNAEPNQKLTEIVVGAGVSSIKMRRWFQNP